MSRATEIYPLHRLVAGELEKIRSDSHNSASLLRYHQARVADGITPARLYKCLWTMRRISTMLGRPFEDATKDDFVRVMSDLELSGFSDWTKMDFKVILKHFYRWFRNWEDGTPPEVRWIKRTRNAQNKRPILPKDLLTKGEKMALLKATRNPRDRALLEMLFESGRRLGEILTLKIRDMEFDSVGAKLFIDGKTGEDFARIISSVPSLLVWLDNHPSAENHDSPVWTGLGGPNWDTQISYAAARMMLTQVARRAGIKKRVFYYLFRHTRIDETQGILTESQQCMMFGWKFGSRMPAIYMKRYGKHIDDAQMIMNGKIPSKRMTVDAMQDKACARCGKANSPASKLCGGCGALLDAREIMEIDQKKTILDRLLVGIAADPQKFEELRLALTKICRDKN